MVVGGTAIGWWMVRLGVRLCCGGGRRGVVYLAMAAPECNESGHEASIDIGRLQAIPVAFGGARAILQG